MSLEDEVTRIMDEPVEEAVARIAANRENGQCRSVREFIDTRTSIVEYLMYAAPHRYGQGKIHGWRPSEKKTVCGNKDVDGRVERGTEAGITCRSCLRSLESRRKEAQWREERKRRDAEREESDRQWWAWYDQYLQSDAWQRLRSKVMRRAEHMCEGCAECKATQVHHLTYEHVGAEFLFELRAVCTGCHERLTATSRERSR